MVITSLSSFLKVKPIQCNILGRDFVFDSQLIQSDLCSGKVNINPGMEWEGKLEPRYLLMWPKEGSCQVCLDWPLSFWRILVFPARICELSTQHSSNKFLWLSEPEVISVVYNQSAQKDSLSIFLCVFILLKFLKVLSMLVSISKGGTTDI